MREDRDISITCPIPAGEHPRVLMAHGGGGTLMSSLIDRMFIPAFDNASLDERHDGAVVDVGGARVAFTTDTYVVQPYFFPGGDIGSLAVHGTVNDLAMCGARPLVLSVGMVLEEGLPMDDLWRIVRSMRAAARDAGVTIVTGDTKVVDKGKGDGIFINTAGIGIVEGAHAPSPARVRVGDAVVVSGDLGRHGMAIMAAREGLEFDSVIESDSAPLNGMIREVMASGVDVRCLRDLTRGGLAAALVEIARSASVRIEVTEDAVPVRGDVRGACEILGLDPLYVANEGRCVAFVGESDAERVVETMRRHIHGACARVIGRVVEGDRGLVTRRTAFGTTSILDMPSGEQLPRIC